MPYGYFKASSITAGLASWGSFQQIMDFGADSRTYSFGCQVAPNGTDVYFSFVRANYANIFQRDVFLAILDATTGNLRNVDGSVVVAAASLPVTLAQANASFRVVDQTTPGVAGGINSLGLDSYGRPHIVYQESAAYAVGPLSTSTRAGRARLGIQHHPDHRSERWLPGSYIPSPAAERRDARLLRPCKLELWLRPRRRHRNSPLHPRRRLGSFVGHQAVGRNVRLTNPVAPTNASADLRVVFSEQCPGGNGLDPTIYGGNLRQHAYGDSGFITQPYAESAETATYFSRYSTAPAQALRQDVDEIVRSLKAIGIWSALDFLYLGVNQDRQSSVLNLVQNAFDGAFIGTVNVGAFTGWQLDGSSGLIDSSFVPSTAGGKYVQNSASVSTFVLSDGVSSLGDFGLNATTNTINEYGFARYTGDVVRACLNTGFGTTGTQKIPSAVGLFTVRRSGASAQSALIDGITVESDTSASTGLPITSLKLGAVNNTSFSSRKYGAFAGGAALGFTNQGVFSNILRRFFVKYGALGIPTRNLLRYSGDFTNAAWTKGSAVTLTAGYAAGPDGSTMDGTRAVFGSGATSTTGAISQGVVDGGFSANSINNSVYVRSNTGAAQGLAVADSSGIGAHLHTVPTTWTRLSDIVASDSSNYRTFSIYPAAGPNSEPAATDILIAHPQSEPGAPASGYRATNLISL